VKFALVQHDIVWERPEQNFARLSPMIAEAAGGGARLVAMTEMYATGFSMAAERIAEPVDGPSAQFLAAQARAHGVWVGGSIPTRHHDGLPTNRFVLAGPNGEHHHYDKLHPFGYAGEHEHYRAGDRTITVDVEGVRVTPFVCYDLRFGDDFWAEAAQTDVYLVVANWPESRRAHWTTLLRARAIENQAYVVGANRVGSGGGVEYSGDSCIVDPFGEVLATGEPGVEQLVAAEVEPARVAEVRAHYPFLRDRRTFPAS
jgi:predicted amidohydrolase